MAKRKSNRTKYDLAAQVATYVELQSVTLIASKTKRGNPKPDAGPAGLAINVQVNASADKKLKIIDVIVRCSLSAGYEEAAQNVLNIEANFLLRYSVPSPEVLTPARIKAFGELNGILNVWPYWREFVQSMTVRMGFPALVIPVHRYGSMSLQRKRPAKKEKRVAAK